MTKLLVLGVLANSPNGSLYGYEIAKAIVRDCEFSQVVEATCYFAIHALVKEGHLIEASRATPGKRPTKTLYSITETGRAKYRSMIEDAFRDVDEQRFNLHSGLYFGGALSVNEQVILVRDRISKLSSLHNALLSQVGAIVNDVGRARENEAILRHRIGHVGAEIEFSKTLLEGLEGQC